MANTNDPRKPLPSVPRDPKSDPDTPSPPHPPPHPPHSVVPPIKVQPDPPAPPVDLNRKRIAALTQLTAQYREYVQHGGKDSFKKFLQPQVAVLLKAYPNGLPEEPGLIPEGLGPIGWALWGYSAVTKGIGETIGEALVERAVEYIFDNAREEHIVPPEPEPVPEQVPDPEPVPEPAPIPGGEGESEGGCFEAGTLVAVANGAMRAIEALVVGDLVMSRHEHTGATSAQRVEEVFRHDHRKTVVLHLENGEEIRTTTAHRVFARDRERGIVRVGDLAVGDHVRTMNDDAIRVRNVEPVIEEATVYNLSVADYHTYFVGESGVWVHNAKTEVPDTPKDDTGQ